MTLRCQFLTLPLLLSATAALACSTMTTAPVVMAQHTAKEERRLMPASDMDLGPALEGAWIVTMIGEETLPTEPEVTLTIAAGQVTVSAGCNTIASSLQMTDHSARLAPARSTMMACPEPVAALEARLIETMEKVDQLQLSGPNALLFLDRNNMLIMAAKPGEA
jgi:heat shock protein HslJ